MRTAYLAPLLLLAALTSGCSSGVGNAQDDACTSAPVGSLSGNVTSGLFFGFDLFRPDPMRGERASIDDHAAAGGLIPAAGGAPGREIVFYVFETDAAADDAGAQGAGRILDRDGVPDTNGANDIFVAALLEERIDRAAFSYSLAGKFRHARCVTCHSLSKEPGIGPAPVSTAFAQSTHPDAIGAPQPGSGRFQDTLEDSCVTCHAPVLDAVGGEGAFLALGWRNPATRIDADFRLLSTAELASRARSAPDDHFERDRRLTWALIGAVVPSRTVVGGSFGPADDDHDGVLEEFDGDGRRRAVPGGRAAFLAEIEAFLCGAPTDTRAAIVDVALVSRNFDAPAQAPNAASRQPDAAYVPNPDFPQASNVAGTLFVAYASAATDIVQLADSGVSQVYRAALDVVVDAVGDVDLVYTGVQLVSRDAAGMAAGDGDSSDPSLSRLPSSEQAGNAAARIAFVSSAGNLGPAGAPGAVFVRDLLSNEVVQASEPGQGCTSPALDPTGRVVAFVTPDPGTALGVIDTNGVEDVYFSRLEEAPLALEADFPQRASQTNGAPEESDTGASFDPDVILENDERILIAFASQSELDAGGIPDSGANVASNVFLHEFTGIPGNDVRATSQVSLALGLTGRLELPDGASRRPVFAGRPDRIVFESDATNLDTAFLLPPDPEFGVFTYKSGDENSAPDLVLAFLDGLLAGLGQVRATALSVSPAGAFGDGATVAPLAGAFASAQASGVSGRFFASGLTFARNLGAADNHVGLDPQEMTTWISFVRDQAPAPVTQFGRVSDILRTRCMPCHEPGGSNSGGFNMGVDDDALFLELTTGTHNCPPDLPYVLPGDPDGSIIVQVMEGPTCFLNRMPDGLAAVPQPLIDVVRAWIADGAPRE